MKLSTDWLDSVLTKDSKSAWEEIFSHLSTLIPNGSNDINTTYRKLEDDIANIDRVLAC